MRSMSYMLARLIKKARCSAIENSDIHPTAKVESGCQIVNARFGRHSFCGYDCSFVNVDVGSFCSIASKVSAGGSGHPLEFVSTSPVFLRHKDSVTAKFARHNYENRPRVTIGHDVWIGEGAYIKAGVTIGHGSAIGMGSVVTRNVEPYAVVAGNPARLIRYRFESNVISALLGMEWWNWSDEELTRLGRYFNDPQLLLGKVQAH